MTDLCFEEDAEVQCESLIKEAVACDSGNPEIYRVEADLRLVQDRKEDAKADMQKCLSLWTSLDVEDMFYPLYEQRIAMAKVLLELEMHEEAANVLEGLLEEDEDVIDTWYLMGLASFSLDDKDTAVEAFVSALALMARLPVEERDEEQRDSIFEFCQKIGIDGPRIFADLEEQVKSMMASSE